MSVPLLLPERRWYCPNCQVTDITRQATEHMPYHACRGLRGLMAPLVQIGVRAEVVVVEREDYIGTEKVHLDPERGRPVMAVVTKRDNGEDRIINAPVATATARVM